MQGVPWPADTWNFYTALALFRYGAISAGVYLRMLQVCEVFSLLASLLGILMKRKQHSLSKGFLVVASYYRLLSSFITDFLETSISSGSFEVFTSLLKGQ